jgi:putative salt-induced outer membrane protein YdiY
MTNIKKSLLTLVALSSVASAEVATTTDVESKYTNKGKVEASEELRQSVNLGFSSTTGNTETVNVNGRYDFSFMTTGYDNNPLKVAFDASAFFTENNKVKSNEEFVSNLGLEQMLGNGWLGYTGLTWLRNPDFRNYDNKFAVGVGIGKELYNDGQHRFVAKLGTAYNIEDYANNQATEKFASLNEYLEYNNALNKISNLYLKVGAMQNFEDFKEDYEVVGVLGVNFAVGENINLSIEEEVAYDHLPAIGFQKTDTKSIVRLGYNF